MQRIFQAFEFDLACTYANKKFAYFLFCGNNGTLMWFIADSLKQNYKRTFRIYNYCREFHKNRNYHCTVTIVLKAGTEIQTSPIHLLVARNNLKYHYKWYMGDKCIQYQITKSGYFQMILAVFLCAYMICCQTNIWIYQYYYHIYYMNYLFLALPFYASVCFFANSF